MKNIQSFKEKFGTSDAEINKDIINEVISDISDEYNSVDISWRYSSRYKLKVRNSNSGVTLSVVPCLRINSNEKIDEFFFKNVMSKLVNYYYYEEGTELFIVIDPKSYNTFFHGYGKLGRHINLFFYSNYQNYFKKNIYFSLKKINENKIFESKYSIKELEGYKSSYKNFRAQIVHDNITRYINLPMDIIDVFETCKEILRDYNEDNDRDCYLQLYLSPYSLQYSEYGELGIDLIRQINRYLVSVGFVKTESLFKNRHLFSWHKPLKESDESDKYKDVDVSPYSIEELSKVGDIDMDIIKDVLSDFLDDHPYDIEHDMLGRSRIIPAYYIMFDLQFRSSKYFYDLIIRALNYYYEETGKELLFIQFGGEIYNTVKRIYFMRNDRNQIKILDSTHLDGALVLSRNGEVKK